MAISLTANGTALPAELTELRRGDELLWSEGTGRGATDGLLVGSVVARKQTWQAVWAVLTKAQYDVVRAIPQGFFTLLVKDGNTTIATLTVYRSNVEGQLLGTFGGTTYWRDVSVQFIER